MLDGNIICSLFSCRFEIFPSSKNSLRDPPFFTGFKTSYDFLLGFQRELTSFNCKVNQRDKRTRKFDPKQIDACSKRDPLLAEIDRATGKHFDATDVKKHLSRNTNKKYSSTTKHDFYRAKVFHLFPNWMIKSEWMENSCNSFSSIDSFQFLRGCHPPTAGESPRGWRISRFLKNDISECSKWFLTLPKFSQKLCSNGAKTCFKSIFKNNPSKQR